MEFHLNVVIACVFLASLFSLLALNRIFRGKTFEEIVAEKKAITDQIYKSTVKKSKKPQTTKKDGKRDKKQQQQRSKDTDKENEYDSSEQVVDMDENDDVDVEDEQPQGLSKTHVEFEPDPQILTDKNQKEINKNKTKKDKKNAKTILVNKVGNIVETKDVAAAKLEETPKNHFDIKPPKDALELKKEQRATEKKEQQQQHIKKDKNVKKDKPVVVGEKQEKQSSPPNTAITASSAAAAPIVEPAIPTPIVIKDVKSQDEKSRQTSPKNQQNNNTKTNKQKKQQKEPIATREFIATLDKLAENGTISVSLLMNLASRAELNRSEIQILIDYLLNIQQDMPATHSEWSDDICQKLKRQLEEKERALTEEQEASIGLQAKLRELRTEINTERLQLNATIKMYIEKLQLKESEAAGLSQELQSVNDKILLERQQFQAKLLREKQAGSQELLAQMQKMQNDLVIKDNYISDMVSASRQTVEESQQKNDIIHQQMQQIHTLERQRDEAEEIANKRNFELEQLKTLETQLSESKVEIHNLQNAYESMKADLTQASADLHGTRNELQKARTIDLIDKQKEIQLLQGRNDELLQQINGITNKTEEKTREQSNLQLLLDKLNKQLIEKEQQLVDFHSKNGELSQQLVAIEQQKQGQALKQQVLEKLVDTLKTDVVDKQKQLQEVEQQISSKYAHRETELLSQLSQLKEKNDDIRRKNWKLVEALQNAEAVKNTTTAAATANIVQQKQQLLTTSLEKKPAELHGSNVTTAPKDEPSLRELLQRLYPDAVKACAATSLTLAFDQWIEQVLSTYIKQSINKQLNTQNANSNSNTSNNHKATQSTLNTSTSNNNTSSSNSDSGSGSGIGSISVGNNNNNNNNSNSSNYNSTYNTNNINNNLISNESNLNNNNNNNSNNINKTISSSSNMNLISGNNGHNLLDVNEVQALLAENTQLRAQNDELTKLVTKTSNTLSDLENQARDQDETWRNIVHSKDEQISRLQQLDGKENI